MVSVVSSNEQIVIVREEAAIRAVDVESGETRWINREQRFSAVTSSGDGASLVLVQGPEDLASDGAPSYVQLDLLTGERVASGFLPRVTGFASQVGPAFVAGKVLWVTSGARDNPRRTIWQISPSVGPDTGW